VLATSNSFPTLSALPLLPLVFRSTYVEISDDETDHLMKRNEMLTFIELLKGSILNGDAVGESQRMAKDKESSLLDKEHLKKRSVASLMLRKSRRLIHGDVDEAKPNGSDGDTAEDEDGASSQSSDSDQDSRLPLTVACDLFLEIFGVSEYMSRDRIYAMFIDLKTQVFFICGR
jgi:hypothetical protein